jgi:hypothetical protein
LLKLSVCNLSIASFGLSANEEDEVSPDDITLHLAAFLAVITLSAAASFFMNSLDIELIIEMRIN